MENSETMEGRRWEEMETECLVTIFQHLGLDDLTTGVPFVCKSWLAASLDPLCWMFLDFRSLDLMPWSRFAGRFTAIYSPSSFSISGFMRFAVDHSRRCAVDLRYPTLFGASLDDLIHASIECPKLKVLELPYHLPEVEEHIPALVGRWPDLERLEMESKPSSFCEMVRLISLNCKRFHGLRVSGAIKEEDATAIISFLPKLKHLDLSKSYLQREQLLAIVNGCKVLERLTVRDCIGFVADDEILQKVSGIKTFVHEGSKMMDDSCYETDEDDDLRPI